MKKFTVTNGDEIVAFDYPTNVNEIDMDWLKEQASKIGVAGNRCLIALVHIEKIATIVMTFKQKRKDVSTSVIPIFIKAGETDSEFIKNLHTKDKLIIPTSSLVNAIHVKVPGNRLSLGALTSVLEGDPGAFARANADNFTACFVEFKLIQNFEIAGSYTDKA